MQTSSFCSQTAREDLIDLNTHKIVSYQHACPCSVDADRICRKQQSRNRQLILHKKRRDWEGSCFKEKLRGFIIGADLERPVPNVRMTNAVAPDTVSILNLPAIDICDSKPATVYLFRFWEERVNGQCPGREGAAVLCSLYHQTPYVVITRDPFVKFDWLLCWHQSSWTERSANDKCWSYKYLIKHLYLYVYIRASIINIVVAYKGNPMMHCWVALIAFILYTRGAGRSRPSRVLQPSGQSTPPYVWRTMELWQHAPYSH